MLIVFKSNTNSHLVKKQSQDTYEKKKVKGVTPGDKDAVRKMTNIPIM
jgi:hypothetical protein